MSIMDTSSINVVKKVYDTMAYEISVLMVFFVSWLAWQFVRRHRRPTLKKEADPAITARGRHSRVKLDGQTPESVQRTVMNIIALSQDQYTRALRMYRDLARRGDDVHVRDEAFYFALVQASIRVGNADVVCEVLRAAKKNNVTLTVQFFQSILKLLASKLLFKECLVVQELFGASLPAERTVCSCMTLAATECGNPEAGMKAVERLKSSSEEVTGRDYLNLFRFYAKASNWEASVALLNQLCEDGIVFEAIVTNLVLSSCVTAHRTDKAAELLTRGEQSDGKLPLDAVSYNTVLKGYAREHKLAACFDLISAMYKSSIQADEVTYSTLLDSCIAENDFDRATAVIDNFVNSGCTMNTVLYTTFMKGFVRMHRVDKAMSLYKTMRKLNKEGTSPEEQPKPDVILYSVLIKANCDQRELEPALVLIQDMLEDGLEPDDIIINRLLDGCRHLSNGVLADQIFKDFVDSGRIKPTPPTIATMVKIYGKCARVDDAAMLVRTMEQRFNLSPSVVIYTCLMSACARNRRVDLAFEAFELMLKANITPDGMTYETILKACAVEKDWGRSIQVAQIAAERSKASPGSFPREELLSALHGMLQMPAGASKHAPLLRRILDENGVSVSAEEMRKPYPRQTWNGKKKSTAYETRPSHERSHS